MATSDPSPENEPHTEPPANQPGGERFSLLAWIRNNPLESVLFAGIIGVLLYFYGIKPYYGNVRELSPIQWMWNVCGKPDFDYMHGRLIPLIIAGLVWYRWPQLKAAEKGSERWGLVIAIIGIIFFIIAARVVQARIAAGSLPIVVFGLIAYIWGRNVAKYMFFPCCLIYFAIPMPGLMQATNNLQIFSTQTAAFVGGLFGIELHSAGSQIHSVPADKWQFEVDTGCSGIRSLVALTLIAAIYGHLTQDRLWKKVFLIVAALPLAVLANAGRVTTIVLIAEYIDPGFARLDLAQLVGLRIFPSLRVERAIAAQHVDQWRLQEAGAQEGADEGRRERGDRVRHPFSQAGRTGHQPGIYRTCYAIDS